MNTILGKYTPYHTVIHRLDARIKLVGLILFMVSVFLNYGTPYMNLVVYAGTAIILLLFSIIGKASFIRLLKSLMGLWVMMAFLLFLNLLLPGSNSGDIAFTLWGIKVYYLTLINVSYIIIRLILVLMMTNIFTATTKPMEMTSALEWLFAPLKLIRIPVHKFAMAISLALRFIPTLAEETNRIMKSQASRGVDYKRGRFRDKIKAITSLIIPLFISSFMISGELADAMEARGYDPDAKRTRYRTSHFGVTDAIASVVVAGCLATMILLAVQHYDMFAYFHIALPDLGLTS